MDSWGRRCSSTHGSGRVSRPPCSRSSKPSAGDCRRSARKAPGSPETSSPTRCSSAHSLTPASGHPRRYRRWPLHSGASDMSKLRWSPAPTASRPCRVQSRYGPIYGRIRVALSHLWQALLGTRHVQSTTKELVGWTALDSTKKRRHRSSGLTSFIDDKRHPRRKPVPQRHGSSPPPRRRPADEAPDATKDPTTAEPPMKMARRFVFAGYSHKSEPRPLCNARSRGSENSTHAVSRGNEGKM